jgi:hypothetical protein
MLSRVSNEIEREFERLSPAAQLSLLEQLLRRVRISLSSGHDPWEAGLSASAADPEVRRELDCCKAECQAREPDGLRGD